MQKKKRNCNVKCLSSSWPFVYVANLLKNRDEDLVFIHGDGRYEKGRIVLGFESRKKLFVQTFLFFCLFEFS